MSGLTPEQKRGVHHAPCCGHLVANHDGSGCVTCTANLDECDVVLDTVETTYSAVAALIAEAVEQARAERDGWLDRLEAAAGYGPLSAVAAHQRTAGVEGDHETRLREARVQELVTLVSEATSFRDDGMTVESAATLAARIARGEVTP